MHAHCVDRAGLVRACFGRAAAAPSTSVLCKLRGLGARFGRGASNALCRPRHGPRTLVWVPVLYLQLQMTCVDRPRWFGAFFCARVRLQMHCVDRAVSVRMPVLDVRVQMRCVDRAGLVPVLCVRLQMYRGDRAAARFGCLFLSQFWTCCFKPSTELRGRRGFGACCRAGGFKCITIV